MLQTVQLRPHCVHRLDRKNQRCVRTAVASPDTPSTSGRTLEYAPTRAPKGPGFLAPDEAGVDPWVRPPPVTITPPSVRDTGTLRPAAEWFPAWMKYRRREENYVFWQDKLQRCSLDVPGGHSSVGWLRCCLLAVSPWMQSGVGKKSCSISCAQVL